MARVLNAILTHQSPACVARMLEWWGRCVDLDHVLIAAGGSESDGAGIAHPRKIFVDDPRLHTVDHQRELQSFTGLYRAISQWLAGRDYTHILFCEYDHFPLAPDFNDRYLARIAAEDADVIGCQVCRVDGTSDPHYLFHQTNPEFHPFWAKTTRRADPRVVLSMFGSGTFWTREAFDAVAAQREPFPIYLELYLPTVAHHLGFRVRDIPDQNPFIQVLPDREHQRAAARKAGAWAVHPVKRIWDRKIPQVER